MPEGIVSFAGWVAAYIGLLSLGMRVNPLYLLTAEYRKGRDD